MISFLLLLSFLSYTISIFFLNNIYILIGLLLGQIIAGSIISFSLKRQLISILKFLPFILITVLIDYFLIGLNETLLIGLRLLIICNATYLMSKFFTPHVLVEAIKILLFPLKLFKVNIDDISLLISISFSFFPILYDEIFKIKISLRAKNFKLGFKNIFKHGTLIFSIYFKNVIKRINQLDLTLCAMGYQNT